MVSIHGPLDSEPNRLSKLVGLRIARLSAQQLCANEKINRHAQDLNLESPLPETDALSMRPTGHQCLR